jgi:hypothetical protein
VAWRLLPVFAGMLFAQGRRTVTSWLRAGGLQEDYRAYYCSRLPLTQLTSPPPRHFLKFS